MLQMVLSGHVACAASDLCYQDDPQTYLLRLMETGSGLYLSAFATDAEAVKYTDFAVCTPPISTQTCRKRLRSIGRRRPYSNRYTDWRS